jgi:hypothetical protein
MPSALPENDGGDGLLPLTLIVKSEAFLFPPPSLITFFITINFDNKPGM